MMRWVTAAVVAVVLGWGAVGVRGAGEMGWPEQTAVSRPWVYWWWMGSAVDEGNITRELERFHKAGVGGVHIIPIYGAKGWEEKYIDYLSPRWMAVMGHVGKETQRLGMRFDMTLGTGWCFGGPGVTAEEANARVVSRVVGVKGGEGLTQTFEKGATQTLVAVSEEGKVEELTERIGADGRVDWTAPAGGAWRVYAVTQRPSGQKVKRPGPGGEGPMLNPFYGKAVEHFVERFEKAFAGYQGVKPRAVYHDSYEYQVDWSPDLFSEFEKRRGYRLQGELPALFGGSDERAARVKGDYRATVSEMMVERFMPPWVDWAHKRGMITRNEAHGSPGNLLDLYAAADIPETEMFNKDRNVLVAKFASSAAHVTGRNLVSCETGTWVAEHFHETPATLKKLVDELFVSGVNHVFYHGSCYSPDEAAWPGWVFYASTQTNARNSIWRDIDTLNGYVARCQSVLQSGRAGNDVLVYWPIHDQWHDARGMTQNMSVHNTGWLTGQAVGRTAKRLWERGYGFDYVSDRLLAGAVKQERGYRAVVVPEAGHMPVETMRGLVEFARAGGLVVFDTGVPTDVPGLGRLDERRAELKGLVDALGLRYDGTGLQRSQVGSGWVYVGEAELVLERAGIARESMVDRLGPNVVRRKHDEGYHYFVTNPGEKVVDANVRLGTPARSVVILDPMTGRTGVAAARTVGKGGGIAYRVRLRPGESVILRTFTERVVEGAPWGYDVFEGEGKEITGEWDVKFVDGGPEMPGAFKTNALGSWTDQGDENAKRFAGAAVYSIAFDAPADVGRAMLDLGTVCHTARVRVNGREAGRLIGPPYQVVVEGLKPRGNVLEVEVTNLSANRVRDLDRRKVAWKYFRDINIVNIDYKPFDASGWAVEPSGLIGPVRLVGGKE